MKILPLLLTASLVGNLALVAVVMTAPAGGKQVPADTAAASTTKLPSTKPATAGAGGSAITADVDSKVWNDLSAGDGAALVARLKAEGFPPAIIRAIIYTQMGESFTARRKALTAGKGNAPFWMNDQPNDPKVTAALRELSREQTKLMKELLGPAANDYNDPVQAAYLRRQFGNLTNDKIEQLSQVRRDYNELRSDLYTAAGMGGGGPLTLTPDERAKMALLEKEQRADIQQLLSPQEFEDYELRSSNTANQMRYNLSAFEPSEQEFRTIFPLQRAFDEQYRMMQMGDSPSQEVLRQRNEAQKQLTAQIAATLGPERGAEYERALDYNYQQITRVVQRLDLPKQAAAEVWALQKDIEQRANAARSLKPAERTAQLTALAQEANAKLTSTLGQRGLDVYKQYGGYWMQNLQPPANPNQSRPSP